MDRPSASACIAVEAISIAIRLWHLGDEERKKAIAFSTVQFWEY
ncbi:hypothetical protein [Microcoleus sp. FACHB-831]|nr:hypothetical protein [Microcoleus sp. FACHB-831]